MSVSRSIRFQVFVRDNRTCQYCGAQAPDVKLEVDHIVPVSRGGSNKTTNLITSCYDCNHGKKARELPAAFIEAIRPRPVPPIVKERRQQPKKRRDVRVQEKPRELYPVARTWPRDEHGEWLPFQCSSCGMVNTPEGDACSCWRRSQERYAPAYYCVDCSSNLDADEYDEDQHGRCEECYLSWRAWTCYDCGDEKTNPDEDYCEACRAS